MLEHGAPFGVRYLFPFNRRIALSLMDGKPEGKRCQRPMSMITPAIHQFPHPLPPVQRRAAAKDKIVAVFHITAHGLGKIVVGKITLAEHMRMRQQKHQHHQRRHRPLLGTITNIHSSPRSFISRSSLYAFQRWEVLADRLRLLEQKHEGDGAIHVKIRGYASFRWTPSQIWGTIMWDMWPYRHKHENRRDEQASNVIGLPEALIWLDAEGAEGGVH